MKKVKEFIHHFALPRESNNHRSKLLHHSSLIIILVLLLVMQSFQITVETRYPQILGVSHSITPEELLLLTNIKRQEQGLPVLQMNPVLAKAAASKAQDMFAKNYWAHNAPDGTTPWVFIKGSGYEYIYAGENLARGFTSATDVVEAWMESPGHRENMLSKNYNDIGFAIMTGNLNGDETVLVVEMFGTTASPFIAKDTASSSISPTPVQKVASVAKTTVPTVVPTTAVLPTLTPTAIPLPTIPAENSAPEIVASTQHLPLINSESFSKNISVVLISMLILILAADLWVTEKNRIVRAVAHNLDHIVFLCVILTAVLFFTRGIII